MARVGRPGSALDGALPGTSRSGRLVDMSEFQQQIEARLESARSSLAEARREGDDYLAQVRLGEIESLQRLQAEHTAA